MEDHELAQHGHLSQLEHLKGYLEGLGLTSDEVRGVIAELKLQEALALGTQDAGLSYVLRTLGSLDRAKQAFLAARGQRQLGPRETKAHQRAAASTVGTPSTK